MVSVHRYCEIVGLALPLDFIILQVDGEAHRLLDLKLMLHFSTGGFFPKPMN